MKVVVLHSGGLDSTTLLAQAIADGAEEILTVSVKYGSLHNQAEGYAALEVVDWYARHLSIPVLRVEFALPSDIFKGEASALMGEIEMPEMTYQEIHDSEGPSPTVVPFRNANLLSIAAAVADARNYDYVYFGAHGDDAHQWAYPDCTPEFLGAMANAIFIGTYQKVRLVFPFIWMTKGEIVERATMIGAPIHLSWSCYDPVFIPPKMNEDMIEDPDFMHCGKCPTCIERANAFAEAGFIDPTPYYIGLDAVLGDEYPIHELESWPE